MQKPPDLVKLYYRIGEVSQIVGVQPHVLRYWETEFRTIRPQKSSKGQRIYSRRDVEKLLRVKDLLRNQGFTIAGARRRLRENLNAPVALAPEPVVEAQPVAAEVAPSTEASEVVARAPSVAPQSARSEASLVAPPDRSAKPMRRALVALREEIIGMMEEIDADTASSRPPQN